MAQTGSTGVFRVGYLLKKGGVLDMTGAGAPTDGVAGTGFGKAGIGSSYTNTTNGAVYINTGTLASPTWSLIGTVAGDSVTTAMLTANSVTPAKMDVSLLQYASVTIAAADIIAVGAGKFGHANGYPLVVGPGAGKVLEFISATLIYDQGVKAYQAGGDTTVNWESGGAILSNKIANSELCAHNGDTVNLVNALVPATGISLPINTGINLVTAAAFTDAGVGAIGVVRAKVLYRVNTTGL